MDYLINRLKEPSSWAGLGVLFNSLGISTELSGNIITAMAGIAAIIAMIKRSPQANDAPHS